MALLLNPQGLPEEPYVHLLPESCEDGGGGGGEHPWFKEDITENICCQAPSFCISWKVAFISKQSLVVGMGQTETIKGSKLFRP